LNDSVFFLSDTHFTYHTAAVLEREKRRRFLGFLGTIRGSRRLYLVGDTFDFWFEYSTVIPRFFGDILLGLYGLRESGTEIFIMGGNHDHWLGSYFPDTLGITVLPPRVTHELQGRRITLTHGDTLLPGDHGYKMLKTIIRSRPVVALSRCIHPDVLYRFAHWFSVVSREVDPAKTEHSARIMCERAESDLFSGGNDVFIMGHIHYPLMKCYGDKVFVILGDWETHCSFLRLEGGEMFLESYRSGENTLIEKR
jgi:UDP-2,3-diacylglucosamine hydrolase